MGQLKFCDPHQQQMGLYHEASELEAVITYGGEEFEIKGDICPTCVSVFWPMVDWAKGNGPWPIPAVDYSSPVEAAIDAPLAVSRALPAPAPEPETEAAPEVPANVITVEPEPEAEPEAPAPKVPPQRRPSDSAIAVAKAGDPGKHLVYCLHKRCIHNGASITVLPIGARQKHAHTHGVANADEIEWGVLEPPQGKAPLEACPICGYPSPPGPGRAAHLRSRHPNESESLR